MKLPLVTSYSNLQLRLGYLKILAAIGTRSPTTNEAFERKLAPLFPSPPSAGSILTRANQRGATTYIKEMFNLLGHKKGLLNQQNLNEIIKLGKALGFLHPTNCSLFEIAVVLRSIMTSAGIKAVQEMDQQSRYNPLQLDQGDRLWKERAFFLVQLLLTDLPVALVACAAATHAEPFRLYDGFPARGEKLIEGVNAIRISRKISHANPFGERDASGTIRKGSKTNKEDDSLVPYSEKNILLDSYNLAKKAENQLAIENWREWRDYFEGDEPKKAFEQKKFFRMGRRSSFRHHATPRLEFLVDLGLLNAHASPEDEQDSNYCYARNDCTQRFASFFNAHFLNQEVFNIDKFVRERAMQCFGEIFNIPLRDPSLEEPKEFLLKGYRAVKRDIGTTPMWTTALMSSLLALDAGIRIEIASFYELAREKAQEEHAKIRLSGGSRFDGEFLIYVSPEMVERRFES
jgi:hypothetical protein